MTDFDWEPVPGPDAWEKAAALIAVAFLLLVLVFLGGCGQKPETQADMLRVGVAVEKACAAAALTQEDCSAAEEALTRLGVSLKQADAARFWGEVFARVLDIGTQWIERRLGG